MAAARRWLERPALRYVLLFLALLCLMPPDGALSDNEEFYFQVSAQKVGAAPAMPESAVFDSSHHRFLADHLLGWLIAAVGYAPAQIIARALAAAAYALALGTLFRRAGLGTVEGLLIIIVFALMGQTLFGGEWLFGGFEAKVAAYALVLAALARVLAGGGLLGVALLLAGATYFHFLVGGFWFIAALLLALIQQRRPLAAVARAALLFLVLVAPLAASIVVTQRAMVAPVDAGAPSADVIYSIIRAPHHTSPFLDGETFVHQWLPGYLLASGMLVACLAGRRFATATPLKAMTLWLALLLGYLFLALVPASLDRSIGFLGKFYLFRPAALILLLWLVFVAAWLGELGLRHRIMLQLCILALITPIFLLNAALQVAGEREARRPLPATIAAALRAAPETAAILIDPQLDFVLLDLERRIGRPTLVSWKFEPATGREIVDWYRRMQFRDTIFDGRCEGADAYPIGFLLTTAAHAVQLAPRCGPVIATGDGLALLRPGG